MVLQSHSWSEGTKKLLDVDKTCLNLGITLSILVLACSIYSVCRDNPRILSLRNISKIIFLR